MPPKLNSLKAGTTQRDDVVKALEGFETGVSGPTYIWARWMESDSGWAAVVAGYNTAAIGGDRTWRVRNFVASFDANGVLKNYQTFAEKDLHFYLERTMREAGVGPPADPVVIEYEASHWGTTKTRSVRLDFGEDSLRYEELEQASSTQVPFTELRSFSIDTPAISETWSGDNVRFSLRFQGPTKMPGRLKVTAHPTYVWDVVSLLQRKRPDLVPKPPERR